VRGAERRRPHHTGTLTIGTDNPAYPPYFQGGTPKDSEWKINDPNTGEGFESAVGYEIASRMGLATVGWVVVPFRQSYAPGPKSFDLDLNQVSYSAKRAEAVDFSESYYDVNQALVVVKGTPIATPRRSRTSASTRSRRSGLRARPHHRLARPEGDRACTRPVGSVAALNAGQVDGIVVDYPTAVIADPFVQEVKTSFAQFPKKRRRE
jgi:polar amino acid transport system substrate-binding protein